MPQPLDYRNPKAGRRSAIFPLGWAMIASLLQQVLALGLYGGTLDGGGSARTCLVVAACYWLMVVWIGIRRRQGKMMSSDWWFIAFGYTAMLIPCVIAREIAAGL